MEETGGYSEDGIGGSEEDDDHDCALPPGEGTHGVAGHGCDRSRPGEEGEDAHQEVLGVGQHPRGDIDGRDQHKEDGGVHPLSILDCGHGCPDSDQRAGE